MSHDVCERLALLEERRAVDRRKCDRNAELIENNEEAHAEIVTLLLKIKYSLYGGFGFLMAHEVGAIPVIRKIVGL